MTTYDELVARTLAHGVMPAVVPQLKTITLGGAVAGVGIEASSFSYGLVHDTLLELEVLLGRRPRRRLHARTTSTAISSSASRIPTARSATRCASRRRTVPVKPFVELTHVASRTRRRFSSSWRERARRRGRFRRRRRVRARTRCSSRSAASSRARRTSATTRSSTSTTARSARSATRLPHRRRLSSGAGTPTGSGARRTSARRIPLVRRLYGRARLESRPITKIMRWNSRWGVTQALERLRGGHSRVGDPGRRHSARARRRVPRLLRARDRHRAVWICPIGRAPASASPLYPMQPGTLYVNFGFWDVLRTRRARIPRDISTG